MSDFHPGGGEPPHRAFAEALLRGASGAPPDALKRALSAALAVARSNGHEDHVAYEEASTFLDRYSSMPGAIGPDAPFEASDHLEALHGIPGLGDKVAEAWYADLTLQRLLNTPASSGPGFTPGGRGAGGPTTGAPRPEYADVAEGTELSAGDPLMEALGRAAFNAEADIRGMEPGTGPTRPSRPATPKAAETPPPADPLAEEMPKPADPKIKDVKRGGMPDGYMREYGWGAWGRNFLYSMGYLLQGSAGAVRSGLEEVRTAFDTLRAANNVTPSDLGRGEPRAPRTPRDPGEAFRGNVDAYRSGRSDVMLARERMKRAVFAGVKIAAIGVEIHRHPEMGAVIKRIQDTAILHGLTPDQVMQMMQPGGKHAELGDAWARAGSDPEAKRLKEAMVGAVTDWRNKWELAATDAQKAGFEKTDIDALFTKNQNMVLTAVGSVPDLNPAEPGRLKQTMENAKKAAESIARLIARIFNQEPEAGYSPG